MRNEVIRERCGLKEDVVTKVEKSMLRWFGHVERMSERRLIKEIYVADVSEPTLTLLVLQKGRVHSTRNRRACMTRCMNVDETKGVCKDRSRCRSVVSAYPMGKRREFRSYYLFKSDY